jgi:hypothetical protein
MLQSDDGVDAVVARHPVICIRRLSPRVRCCSKRLILKSREGPHWEVADLGWRRIATLGEVRLDVPVEDHQQQRRDECEMNSIVSVQSGRSI